MLWGASKAKTEGTDPRRRIADISPKVRQLIDEAKTKDAEERKRTRLKRAVMVPVLMMQVTPIAADVLQIIQPLARGTMRQAEDVYEGVRRSP